MERNNIATVNNGNKSQVSIDKEEQNRGGGVLGWWYRHFAPPEPSGIASLAQREKARRGKMASVVVLMLILIFFTLLPQNLASKNFMQVIVALVGIGTCFFALFLNRRGFVGLAGALILIQLYSGQVFTTFTLPGGLTVGNLGGLDFTVIPDILVLAFFSTNSLFLIVCINIIMTGFIVVYGPHDAAITSLLYHEPQQIFAHAYILQLLTAAALYLWARSTEQALKRADRAEEIAALEKHENEWQQRELEQKRKLDTGIQQLLQTLVAAANGDLKARAPLSKDHVLWQIAVALNNLIARLQSLSHTESELRQQIWEGNERATDHHNAIHLVVGRTTGAKRALPPGRTMGAQKAQRSKSEITGQQPGIKRDGDARGGTGGRLRALRLELGGETDQEKVTRAEPGGITVAQEVMHPERSDAKGHVNKCRE